jgi:hypothetical protein
MTTLGDAFGLVAPYYNLAFVVIALILFMKLFSYGDKKFAYVKPWKILVIAVLVYIIEEVITILAGLNLLTFPLWLFPAFEMVMVLCFIYMILLQKQYVKTGKRD